jgi:hypothetical protein
MPLSRSPVLGALVALAVLSAPGTARADDATVEPPPKPTRRNSFTFGLDVGLGVASIVGYPNDVNKIGFASYYTTTGARPAGVLEAWIGGAITDWITLSLGFKGSRLVASEGQQASSLGAMFHVEAYPLFALGGHLRDLGVRMDAGLGTASVKDAMGTKVVDGSSTSTIGGGVFYEGIRAWKIGQGPFLMGDYIWSDTARRPAIFLGWRAAFYAGPPRRAP